MSQPTIQQAILGLADEPSGQLVGRVKELAGLIASDLPLQAFLEQLLPLACELFEGSAAVAWLKAHGAQGAVFGIQYRMDKLICSTEEQKRHERLVQLAWQQKRPMLAEPREQGSKQDESDNPTSRSLLFGPIMHLGDPIALLEVALSERSSAINATERKLYLRGIQLVTERVYGGLRRRMTLPAATTVQATQQLELLTQEIHAHQQQIRRSIESRLAQFHGWSFGSLDENQRFAKMVHQFLDAYGLRIQCPECNHPAILRCLRAGNAKHGVFVFDHYLDSGRTFHGGPTTVPVLRVIGKPIRRLAIGTSGPEK